MQKHINIDDYIIWDPCCGTGNLFKDLNNEVFDFLDKDRLYLSDIDGSAVDICKRDKGFKDSNVFQFDYQNTIVEEFSGMPTILQKIIKELNKINTKYDLKRYLPKLGFKFDK